MVSKILASIGLLIVLAISLHWLLGAQLRSGRRLPAWLRKLYALLDGVPRWLAPEASELRRQEMRQERRQAWQRRSWAQSSQQPEPDDDAASTPPVEWDGNVARPRFGDRKRRHNLH